MGSKIADLKAQEQAQQQAAKAAEREALANDKLNSAYNQLNSARAKAKNTLRDLIASESASNAEIKKAQKEFDVLDQKVRKADKAVGDFSKSVGNYKGALSGIGNLMGAFGISTGIYLFADLVKNIYQTTKQLQSMDLALKMVSGSQSEFSSNQVFLTQLAEQYGIEIKGLTKNFTEFWVASKGKLEAEQIKAIFTSISKSVAVMGLSVEQQDSAFLALQQMMSKGTVQAEELKKQLGNALPGAVKAATMAYQALHPELQVTEEMFMKQMKAGKVLSSELLPELAKAYEKLYGIENVQRAETLQAAQERLSNSWTQMVRNMNSSETGGISRFFKFVLDGLTELADFINFLNKDDRAISIVNEGKVR
jgi:tape measure domain-containing protein